MKLNLLPQSVSKAGAARGMVVVALAMAVLGVLAAVFMTVTSDKMLADAKESAISKQKLAADAKATADQAEAQIAAATIITKNQKLAEAMNEHNRKYVDLYRDVLRYVPSYYRLESIRATPTGPGASSVTLVGYIESFRQYADLAIALWKIPDAMTVTRAGYQIDDASVQPLTESDQIGSAIKADETPLPSDPLARMEAMIAQAASEPRGFLNIGGFGTTDVTSPRGAMPGYSQVTMTVTMSRDIQTPDPRATIASGGGAPGPSGVAPGFGNVPGGGARR
ncbi:MAG: hypothetical protein KF824_07600 [Fimbriimonadaceae bacterium]|nr:MAG: hypothetical protein KF824_07600 [Fimbriimonadaceae bacterium]